MGPFIGEKCVLLHVITEFSEKWERSLKRERTVFFREQTNCVQLQKIKLKVLWGCTAAFE